MTWPDVVMRIFNDLLTIFVILLAIVWMSGGFNKKE